MERCGRTKFPTQPPGGDYDNDVNETCRSTQDSQRLRELLELLILLKTLWQVVASMIT
jgi:hypothetical protein